MEVLKNFGWWDQENDLWFTNHKPLIPTMKSELRDFHRGSPMVMQIVLKTNISHPVISYTLPHVETSDP